MARRLDQPTEHTMSFGDHLDELRKRILLAVIVPLPVAVLALPFTDTLIEILLLPLFGALAASGLPQTVQALSPAEVVLTQIKLCILAAAIFGAPWIL
jgi:Sec-independent protein secretion pathway component TatC